MAFNLDAFIGANSDFARGYTFYAYVDGYNMSNDQKFLVKSTSLPASTNSQAEVNWQGNTYKIATTQEFAEFTISYSLDIADDLRHMYVDWMRQIHDPETNLHGAVGGFSGGYLGTVHLEHVSHLSGDTIMEYELKGAWPSSVTEVALDYGSKEIATFDVTFTYQYHTTV